MKRKFISLTLLFAGVFMLASCLSDDTDDSNIVYYGDAAITSFSLGTLNKTYLYNNGDTIKKNTDGTDSTTTVDCSKYKLTIDQLKHEVYNVDSLPAGVNFRKVVCAVNTKNAGILALKRLKKKDTDKDTLDYYTSDSVDFSVPREFRVYSTDGTNYRNYEVRLNVHKEQPDSFVWHRQSVAEIVGGMSGVASDMKLLPMGDKMYMAIADGHNMYIAVKDINDDSKPWRVTGSNMNMVFTAEGCKNIAVFNNYIYLYNQGNLFRAADGRTWEKPATEGFNDVKRLVGAGNGKLYATTSSGIISSADGVKWTAATLDGEATALPVENVTVCTLPSKTNKDVERVLMIGDAQQGDTAAVVWGKLEDKSESVDSYQWSQYEGVNKYMLPNMKGLSVMVFDGKLYAIGGEGQNGSKAQPYNKLYCSTDQGLTWKPSSLFTLPKDFSKDVDANTVAMAADKDNHIWLVSLQTGEVWKMRINRFGWKTEQKSFNE